MELLNQLYLFEIEDLDLNELNKTEFEMIQKNYISITDFMIN